MALLSKVEYVVYIIKTRTDHLGVTIRMVTADFSNKIIIFKQLNTIQILNKIQQTVDRHPDTNLHLGCSRTYLLLWACLGLSLFHFASYFTFLKRYTKNFGIMKLKIYI